MVGWLSGFWAQSGFVANWRYASFVRRLGEAAAPGGGKCGPCTDFASYNLAFALQLRENHGKTCQGNRRALGRSAPNAIRLVDLVIVGNGLDWLAVPCRPWLSRQATGSTLGQCKCLPRCRTRGFLTAAKFESKTHTQPRYFAVWFPPQPQHWGCSRGVGHSPERREPPHATRRGAYPLLRCVCPKRCQRLHCNGPFGATYDSTDTRKPQISVSDRTLDTSGPRATDTMKWEWEGGSWRGPGRDGRIAAANVQRFELLSDDALRHTPTQVLYQKPHTAVLRKREGVETHTFLPFEGPQCSEHVGGWWGDHQLFAL